MTRASVVQHRGSLWVAELQDWGYEIRTSHDAKVVEGQLVVAARRRAEFALPEVEITVREFWLAGRDPDRFWLHRVERLIYEAWSADRR